MFLFTIVLYLLTFYIWDNRRLKFLFWGTSSFNISKLWWKNSEIENNQNIYDENSRRNIVMLLPQAEISILLNVQ